MNFSMKYLAIDTSSTSIELLLSIDGRQIFRREENGKRASESLLLTIDEMLNGEGITLNDIDCYAVVIGPGSFTGIRIGVNTVKTFSFVTGKPIIAITSLEKFAYNDIDGAESVVCVVPAYADLSYLAVYSRDRKELLSPKCIKNDEVLKLVALVDEPSVVFTDGEIAKNLEVAPLKKEAFARAIESKIAKKEFTSYNALEPFYIVKSQAEREMENKNANN